MTPPHPDIDAIRQATDNAVQRIDPEDHDTCLVVLNVGDVRSLLAEVERYRTALELVRDFCHDALHGNHDMRALAFGLREVADRALATDNPTEP